MIIAKSAGAVLLIYFLMYIIGSSVTGTVTRRVDPDVAGSLNGAIYFVLLVAATVASVVAVRRIRRAASTGEDLTGKGPGSTR